MPADHESRIPIKSVAYRPKDASSWFGTLVVVPLAGGDPIEIPDVIVIETLWGTDTAQGAVEWAASNMEGGVDVILMYSDVNLVCANFVPHNATGPGQGP